MKHLYGKRFTVEEPLRDVKNPCLGLGLKPTVMEGNDRQWRGYNPEDTVRFYALRLHEVRRLTSTPQNIIARRTDWRFLNELKQELKG